MHISLNIHTLLHFNTPPVPPLLLLRPPSSLLLFPHLLLQSSEKVFTSMMPRTELGGKSGTYLSSSHFLSSLSRLLSSSSCHLKVIMIIIPTITITTTTTIITTRPKPAYGRQGLAGCSLRADGAQLGSGK